jgi:hypothetical protein
LIGRRVYLQLLEGCGQMQRCNTFMLHGVGLEAVIHAEERHRCSMTRMQQACLRCVQNSMYNILHAPSCLGPFLSHLLACSPTSYSLQSWRSSILQLAYSPCHHPGQESVFCTFRSHDPHPTPISATPVSASLSIPSPTHVLYTLCASVWVPLATPFMLSFHAAKHC